MNQKKPNVVVVLCDQLRPFELGCYGGEVVRTPNMDRLAQNGVRFETACSNDPVCTPARSVLLSGQYARTCMGGTFNAGEPGKTRRQLADPTLAETFKAAGYHTGLIGKWHVSPKPTILGFDYCLYPLTQHRYTGQTFMDTDGNKTVVPGFTVDYELEGLEKYIRERRDEPFFLFYNISQPHMPLADMPEKYLKMYSRDEVPLRRNVWKDGKMTYNDYWFRIYLWDFLFYQKDLRYTKEALSDGFDLRDLTALYCGAVTWADDQLGRLMELLEEQGIADDTIIVFTSDHGDILGSHETFNKGFLIEESIRIPMIFRWPNKLAPRHVTTQVASLVDVMPTVSSLAGIETPDTAEGTNLMPVLRGESESVGENMAFIETGARLTGIRTLTHLYGIQKPPDGRRGTRGTVITDDRFEFYDLTADPFEENNLAKTGQQPEVAEALRERLIRWDREMPWKGPGQWRVPRPWRNSP